MKTIRTLTLAVMTAATWCPAVSMAQPPDGRHGDDHRREAQDRPAPAPRGGPPPRAEGPDHRGGPRGDMHDMHDARDDRGAGPDHAWRRGGRLPPDFRGHQYVVDDWRGHRLSAPPRGYQWVQTGADYVLVAVATGIIAQVLLGN